MLTILGLDKNMLQKFALNPESSIWNGQQQELQARYHFSSPEELAKISADIQRENKLLGKLISDSGLSSWSKGIYSNVSQATGDEREQIKYGNAIEDDYDMVDDPDARDEDVIME